MRIGIFDGRTASQGTLDDLVASAEAARNSGFHSWWMPQIFGMETLSVLSIVGREVPDIGLGTAVVPTFPRHPVTMAQLALTAQAASGNRLKLGIGLSHEVVIESMFGLSFDHPAQHMEEYLQVLTPLLNAKQVAFSGERFTTNLSIDIASAPPAPPVLVAALGPKMLEITGRLADGTVTWMTGVKTLRDHIVPSITAAASTAGRAAPEVVACLPFVVTDEVDSTREFCAKAFEFYGFLPSYRAVLDREGVAGPAEVAVIGNEDECAEVLHSLREAGVTEFVAVDFTGDQATKERTTAFLTSQLSVE